jgi:hypothetical protein
MDQAAFLRFLLETSRRGYAAGSSAIKTRETDQSTTIVLEEGEWRFHDNYFGGEPYGGREVVFFRSQPVWMAVYYGYVHKYATVDSVYSFLQRALHDAPADFPVRGPEVLTEGRFSYRNVHDGDVNSFSGHEIIQEDGREVYSAHYAGGFVDRRAGD